ncbi:MAG: hypothetical protein H0T89_17485 [Deltaproteobacteria bacterium]|nr:hypothetical protein [Deltaproteobacteria bacterium]MDQ3297872.1 hypothetical protein [Myxococcota bacterium]
MRRAARDGASQRTLASAAVCLGLLHAAAHASPTAVTVEGGAEADSNLQRVETGAGLPTERLGGSVIRVGARVDHRGVAAGGAFALALQSLSRLVAGNEATPENVALLTADLRWVHAIGKRPVSAGFGLVFADALPLADEVGARTFRNLGADALLVLRGTEDRSLTLAVGPRHFEYKPDHDFDWIGAAISARLDLTLWEPSGGTRSVELAAIVGFEARAYDSRARASACPDDAPPSPECFAPTTLARRDRYQRAGVELTWVGRVVAAAGYQLTVIDSNSYGQSLVRHRATVSTTTDLPGKWIGTALATLQIDQYLDGVVVQKDLQHQEFTNLDDANRSSLQLRIARKLTVAWSLEARGAIWRDLGGTLDTSFRRELVYLGGVYNR